MTVTQFSAQEKSTIMTSDPFFPLTYGRYRYMCILILNVLVSIYQTTENGKLCPNEKYLFQPSI